MKVRLLMLITLFNYLAIDAWSQGSACPVNLDFEKGDFSGWQCLQGSVQATNSTNVLALNPTAPGDVHKIIPATNSSVDPYGQFPVSCPNGSRYSIKLGNNFGGHQAEGMSYTFTIPTGANDFAIIYNYAIVLENPSHQLFEQPRFRARVIDVNAGLEISCVSFDFAASTSLPGFKVCTFNNSVLYKDWTAISVNLSEYAGKIVRLEFITSDCTNNQHFGYAYIDVNSTCNDNIMAASLCEGDNFLTLTAQTGFDSYKWFQNNDFSKVVSSSREFSIDPVPAAASFYSLILTPYPGFGCIDTLTATIKREPKPVFEAGPDREIWCSESIRLGTNPNPGFSYSWTPVDKLKNPAVANPWIKPPLFSPVNFIVTTTNKMTGCFSKDSLLINPKNCFTSVPSAFTPDGNGLNDVFRPYLGGKKLVRFSVYDRFGKIVFTTNQEGAGWDGTYKSVKLNPQVFVWILEYKGDDDRIEIEKGTVVLIR